MLISLPIGFFDLSNQLGFMSICVTDMPFIIQPIWRQINVLIWTCITASLFWVFHLSFGVYGNSSVLPMKKNTQLLLSPLLYFSLGYCLAILSLYPCL
jgi:hypothetical protein